MRKLIVKVDTCPSELELVARNSTTVTKQKQKQNSYPWLVVFFCFSNVIVSKDKLMNQSKGVNTLKYI